MKKLSKPFYLGSIVGGVVISVISLLISIMYYGIAGEKEVYSQNINYFQFIALVYLLLGCILIIYASAIYLMLLYKSWQQIQDIHPRTTPGKAIGFLLIPLFFLYWIFVAYWGFARDYNNYIQRMELNIPRLNEDLFLAFCIIRVCTVIPYLGILAVIAAGVLWIIIADKMIDAVNNIRDAHSIQSPERLYYR